MCVCVCVCGGGDNQGSSSLLNEVLVHTKYRKYRLKMYTED